MAITSQTDDQLIQCIFNCERCAHECLRCVNHCLEIGGEHASVEHQRIMQDCAAVCVTAANFMSRESAWHPDVCGLCARVCGDCADDCERLSKGNDPMHKCAQACRDCAETCKRMAA